MYPTLVAYCLEVVKSRKMVITFSFLVGWGPF